LAKKPQAEIDMKSLKETSAGTKKEFYMLT